MANNENDNNYYNVVSDSESDDEAKENHFEVHVDNETEVTRKTTLNPKVVQVMKNLQASYNENADKIVEQPT